MPKWVVGWNWKSCCMRLVIVSCCCYRQHSLHVAAVITLITHDHRTPPHQTHIPSTPNAHPIHTKRTSHPQQTPHSSYSIRGHPHRLALRERHRRVVRHLLHLHDLHLTQRNHSPQTHPGRCAVSRTPPRSGRSRPRCPSSRGTPARRSRSPRLYRSPPTR